MNALQSYSSDDESDGEHIKQKKERQSDHETNYDDVGMDISEDSSGGESEDDDGKTIKDDNLKIHQKKLHGTELSNVNCALDDNSPFHNEAEKNESTVNKQNPREPSKELSTKKDFRGDRNTRDHRDYRDNREPRDAKEFRPSRDHRGGRGRGYRSIRDDDRRRYDDRRGRRSRSKSRERRRSRSRSRSRSRERRRRRSRSRSRDRDRRKPHEIRKEAQQKLAALKAENPNFDQAELLKQGMEAQVAELQKQTGITLPSYYNPAIMNPLKIAEQERKKRLLWGNKPKSEPVPQPVEAAAPQSGNAEGRQLNLWANTKFCNDSDGKMAQKFKRLMGVKAAGAASTEATPPAAVPLPPSNTSVNDDGDDKGDGLKKQESLFSSMEKQYETARLATHTHKGFGLGFSSSQPFVPKQ